jgi:hypothetical protein
VRSRPRRRWPPNNVPIGRATRFSGKDPTGKNPTGKNPKGNIMAWAGGVAAWLPELLVLILVGVATAACAGAPAAPADRRLRMIAIPLLGAFAIGATIWQQRSATVRISRLTAEAHSAALIKQVDALQSEIDKLRQRERGRTITSDAATKLADYLRPFGPHLVVVSCMPDDIEAYRYATELVNVLKSADWDARGPEATTIFGDIKSMAINVYDAGGGRSDTTKILLAGLTKFGIPYQSRVPPSEALPDNQTVELFIGTKPAPPATPSGSAAAAR